MNWLLGVTIYLAALLIAAVINTAMARILEVEISGRPENKVGVLVIRMILSWGLLLLFLELNGAKITWPS